MMAGSTNFDIKIRGVGGHGAMPHYCADPVIAAAGVVQGLQSVVSRNVNPIEGAVISVTRMTAGEAYNVIPDEVVLGGGMRYFNDAVRDLMLQRSQQLVESIAKANGCNATFSHREVFTVLNNEPEAADQAIAAAAALVGDSRVNGTMEPIMGSEDFAFMLAAKPGAYIFIGNGVGEGGCMVHNPEYDFNDDALAFGASYWSVLAEKLLEAS
jgi:hippurate hydrolase